MATNSPRPADAPPGPDGGRLSVRIDDREEASGFAAAVRERWPGACVRRIEVGDVEVGERIVIERKTVQDLAASLRDGRLWRQMRALAATAARPLLLVEGEDAWDVMGLAPEAVRGVLLMTTVGFRVPVLRTADIAESAHYVARIADHEQRRLARLAGFAGRSRARQAMQVLAAIPGIGQRRARRLLDRFGSVAAIGAASEPDLRAVRSIGREIARTIRRVLVELRRGPGA